MLSWLVVMVACGRRQQRYMDLYTAVMDLDLNSGFESGPKNPVKVDVLKGYRAVARIQTDPLVERERVALNRFYWGSVAYAILTMAAIVVVDYFVG